jgi:hypothetical protein
MPCWRYGACWIAVAALCQRSTIGFHSNPEAAMWGRHQRSLQVAQAQQPTLFHPQVVRPTWPSLPSEIRQAVIPLLARLLRPEREYRSAAQLQAAQGKAVAKGAIDE